MDDPSVHIGQPEVTSGMSPGQPFVIESHEMENRRMQVMDVDLVVLGIPAELVGGSVNRSPPDTTSGQSHGETEGVVLTTVFSLGGRRPAEFTTPDDQRIVEETAGFQVGQ